MFWFPEKPQRIYDFNSVPGNYLMQVKKDGWRIIISTIDGQFKLFNREGKPISCTNGYSWDWISDIFGKGFYLDGEVIGRRQGEMIDTIVIWDMLYFEGSGLHSLPYIERYNLLKQFIPEGILFIQQAEPKFYGTHFITENNGKSLLISRNYTLNKFDEVWKELEKDNRYNEGVVFKNPESHLKWSISGTTHSANQLKLKIRD